MCTSARLRCDVMRSLTRSTVNRRNLMAKKGGSLQSPDACFPQHWRDLREWSIEKRQDHRMWVLHMQAVIRSTERKLNASLEKFPRRDCGNSPDDVTAKAKTNGMDRICAGRPIGGG
ncbi:uncharacterized protein LOC144020685 isoform X2 [Festucalex cinctus]